MHNDFKVAVFISGRGSNLQSLVERAKSYRIVAVLSDNPEAKGLDFARSQNIPTLALARTDFKSKSEHRLALFEAVRAYSPNLIALAGFMQIVPEKVTENWQGRLINIHPSLLPDFPGLDTHSRFIGSDLTRHGCTVHLVDSGVDTGPIIAQAHLDRSSEDTAETISARVLALEHKLYPWVVNHFAKGEIFVTAGQVHYSIKAREEAKANDYVIKNGELL